MLAALFSGRMAGLLRLADVVRTAGMEHRSAAQAVKRLAQTPAHDPERQRLAAKLRGEMSII